MASSMHIDVADEGGVRVRLARGLINLLFMLMLLLLVFLFFLLLFVQFVLTLWRLYAYKFTIVGKFNLNSKINK